MEVSHKLDVGHKIKNILDNVMAEIVNQTVMLESALIEVVAVIKRSRSLILNYGRRHLYIYFCGVGLACVASVGVAPALA